MSCPEVLLKNILKYKAMLPGELQTQDSIAERSGLGQTTVGAVLRGGQQPKIENIPKWAKGLCCTEAQLLAWESENGENAI